MNSNVMSSLLGEPLEIWGAGIKIQASLFSASHFVTSRILVLWNVKWNYERVRIFFIPFFLSLDTILKNGLKIKTLRWDISELRIKMHFPIFSRAELETVGKLQQIWTKSKNKIIYILTVIWEPLHSVNW